MKAKRNPQTSLRSGLPWLLGIAFLFGGCSEPASTPKTGSNSNWLHACETDDDCAGIGSCECGACTLLCTDDSACAGLDGAGCALPSDPAAWAQCTSRAPSAGLCLPSCEAGSCGAGQACVNGRCVLAPLPATEFCTPVANPAQSDRVLEDELLALIQSARTEGGIVCPGGAPSSAIAALRLDTRLLCAARVLAADVQVTRNPSLTDSAGRDTPARLSLAGYEQAFWSEDFSFSATASGALMSVLQRAAGCDRIVDETYLDVGIGSVADVQVITLAVE
jgi:hypothetical protein